MRPHPPHVLLFDLQMPEMGGLAVLQAMHDAQRFCCVVLLTGALGVPAMDETSFRLATFAAHRPWSLNQP